VHHATWETCTNWGTPSSQNRKREGQGKAGRVLGMPDVVAQFLGSFDLFESPMDTTQLAETFGVRLTPFEEVARQSVR
jgi:hypothetical protein